MHDIGQCVAGIESTAWPEGKQSIASKLENISSNIKNGYRKKVDMQFVLIIYNIILYKIIIAIRTCTYYFDCSVKHILVS